MLMWKASAGAEQLSAKTWRTGPRTTFIWSKVLNGLCFIKTHRDRKVESPLFPWKANFSLLMHSVSINLRNYQINLKSVENSCLTVDSILRDGSLCRSQGIMSGLFVLLAWNLYSTGFINCNFIVKWNQIKSKVKLSSPSDASTATVMTRNARNP